jgi:hypothetical protein
MINSYLRQKHVPPWNTHSMFPRTQKRNHLTQWLMDGLLVILSLIGILPVARLTTYYKAGAITLNMKSKCLSSIWRRVVFLSLAFILGMTTIERVAIAGDADWTFMVYLDGDNNLEPAAIDDFLEMSKIGSSSNINIVVQFDRIDRYSNRYGNWKDTKRFYIEQEMKPYSSNAVSHLGEANMGDPTTLTDFMTWATTTYPAKHYALVIWNHGDGWKSIEDDVQKTIALDDTDGDRLFMKEVREAIENAPIEIDLIGFDACLMAMVEVAYELKDTGIKIMVGSEDNEPGDGWPYDTILEKLVSNPSYTAAELGTIIVDSYYNSYPYGLTQSAINLEQMDQLAESINEFAEVTMSDWDNNKSLVKNAALDAIHQLDKVLIHEKHGPSWPGSHGLSIYFPSQKASFDRRYNGKFIRFPENTLWDEFLNEFYVSMKGSWIDTARSNSQQYDKPQYIDLYDFFEKISRERQCLFYGVHDDKLNDSQFFTINPKDDTVNPLGPMYLDHDIEGLDIHPNTDVLYASSGDNTQMPGYLYKMETNGSTPLALIGNIVDDGINGVKGYDYKEVDGLSFNPNTDVLWGWSQNDGLLKINPSTAEATMMAAYQGEIEDLTWNISGTKLYAVENLHGNHNVDSHGPIDFEDGIRLLSYDGVAVQAVCPQVIGKGIKEIEALEMLTDELLLFGYHSHNNLEIVVLELNPCNVIVEKKIPVPYNDIEGLAWPSAHCPLD